MGTRFELVLDGEDEFFLRAVGEEAIEEINTWHTRLSAFDKSSTVSLINREAAHRPVQIDFETFKLLELCVALHEQTSGVFDITIGPLMKSFGFRGPISETTDAPSWGMQYVRLDSDACTVTFDEPGMEIDLGGIGKGFALDCAADTLRDHGIERALLHGGTSSVVAIGAPPDQHGWTVGIASPRQPEEQLATVCLLNRALGVSAPSGRMVSTSAETVSHILDPRSGLPSTGAALAAVIGPSAAQADAWSTACIVLNGHPPSPGDSLSSLLTSASGGFPCCTTSGPEACHFCVDQDTRLSTD